VALKRFHGGGADKGGGGLIAFTEPERNNVAAVHAGIGHFADARGSKIEHSLPGAGWGRGGWVHEIIPLLVGEPGCPVNGRAAMPIDGAKAIASSTAEMLDFGVVLAQNRIG